MTDLLGWVVLVVPVLTGAVMLFMPESSDRAKRWKIWLLAISIIYTGIVWWWQARANREAAKERTHAIGEASRRVMNETTEAMGKQYGQIIEAMTKQNSALSVQLGEQGRQLQAIGKSDIVTGKRPIPVTVTNPGPSGAQANFRAVMLPAAPNPKYGKNAAQILITTDQRMSGGRAVIRCKNKINRGEAKLAGVSGVLESGSGMQDEHTFLSGISAPDWSPSYPLVITLYFDDANLGMCDIKALP
ncbi:MAG: hypothetical protein HY508_06940 [Acidobacteria bacterium]|nr:hypothetical protein [Acidobacteriota bacterium]